MEILLITASQTEILSQYVAECTGVLNYSLSYFCDVNIILHLVAFERNHLG